LKYFILFSLLLSTQAFALDFNKVTGSFDVEEKKTQEEDLTKLAYGSLDSHSTEKSRAPASAVEKTAKTTSEVNEVTGSFE
jgi:hypothetical protein